MQVMVTMSMDTRKRAEIVAHVPAEQARIRELTALGKLEALHIAQAGDRAWLVLNVESEEEAHAILVSLPLHAYAEIDLAVLAVPA